MSADPRVSADAERLITRMAAQARLPLDVVRLDQRLRAAASAFVTRSGVSAQSTETVYEFAREALVANRPTYLLDDLRWRTWAALSTGAAFVVCPDAMPEEAQALAVMGFTVIDLPDTGALGADAGEAAMWARLEPGLRKAGLDLPGGKPGFPAPDSLDEEIRLRGFVTRAAEIIAERFVRGLHHAAAVIVDAQGVLWRGLSIEGPSGTTACAHAAALGAAVLDGAVHLKYVAGVCHPQRPGGSGRYDLVPPCAACGEALLEVAPDLHAIVRRDGRPVALPVEDLLPDA